MPGILERLAIIETEVKISNTLNRELLDIVKGTNGHGLITKVAILEKHPETCPAKISVRWLTWAVRAIILLPVIAVIGYYIDKILI